MKFYTYQLGEGDLQTGTLNVITHAAQISAPTIQEAIKGAKEEYSRAPSWESANLVRLLDDNAHVVWFRPVGSVETEER